MSVMTDEKLLFKTASDCFIKKIELMDKHGAFDGVEIPDESPGSDGKVLKGLAVLEYYVQQTLDDARQQRTSSGFHSSFENYLKSKISQFQKLWRYEERIEFGAECALLHYHLSLYLYQQKDKEEGIYHLMEAMHYLGSYEGDFLLQNYLGVQQRNKEKASVAGGKARAEKNKIVKEKAAELLKEKSSEFVGMDKVEIAEAVAQALWAFIVAYNEETKVINQKLKVNEQTRRRIALKKDALPETLLRWWNENPEHKDILTGIVAKKD
ncbi:hypothetical protein J5047_003065 [Salmonella enterica]|nr:hypothetical protein [Salmonella enterica]EEF4030812.1 hypothetical protein [Salmonella enterica]EEJ5984326.1 hypothetical protein [Salmonella enterica]EEL9687917.1 hypothetical protein [Salmonella enterica]EEU3911251.1 hypothetical protein [Salmonella enterica]